MTGKTKIWLSICGGIFLLACSFWIIQQAITVNKVSASGKVAKDSSNVDYSDHADNVRSSYRIFSPPVPDSIDFAGEGVPLNETDVYERFEKELIINTYYHSSTVFFHKRAARWFPVIEPILKEEGVPDDLKFLALIESALDNVVSPAGAAGFWQFMPATAKEYGLEVNNYVDERYHLEKVTRAACRLLKEGNRKFGSWTLSAAAYNMGMGGLQSRMNEQTDSRRYYDLLLPEETMRYVFRIIAVKQIMTHSADYGFRFRPVDLYKPYDVKMVEVKENIADLKSFAKQNGCSYRLLKVLNPWLRGDKLPVSSGKTYQVLLPGQNFNSRAAL